MFVSLFETDEEGSKNSKPGTTGRVSKQNKLNWPPQPRGVTGICGLQNQGATCYLNSLLQTLFFIPEFRGKFDILTSEQQTAWDRRRKKLVTKVFDTSFFDKRIDNVGEQIFQWSFHRLPSNVRMEEL